MEIFFGDLNRIRNDCQYIYNMTAYSNDHTGNLNQLGIIVLGGMLASATTSLSLVPVLFVLFTQPSYGKKRPGKLITDHSEFMEKVRKAESEKFDA
jgi:hypothetical protein